MQPGVVRGLHVHRHLRHAAASASKCAPMAVRNSVLHRWLAGVTRPVATYRFKVSDFADRCSPDPETVKALGHVIAKAKTDLRFLGRMVAILGWTAAKARLEASRRDGLRRGDFGEALAYEILETFDGYIVPVRKLRYQMDPEQSMHGTDIVGLHFTDDGHLTELHFIECKLSTLRDLTRGVEAHQQLVDDRDRGFADTLLFVGERLWETNREVYAKFEQMLADRSDHNRGTYGIILIWDRATWDEEVLERIEEIEDLLAPLHVRVVQLADLRALVEQAYDSIDMDVIDDGS